MQHTVFSLPTSERHHEVFTSRSTY